MDNLVDKLSGNVKTILIIILFLATIGVGKWTANQVFADLQQVKKTQHEAVINDAVQDEKLKHLDVQLNRMESKIDRLLEK